MARLAGLLTTSAGRLVTDETGLPGAYDFVFAWFPGPDAPFLGTALDDQLGLKLVPSERPIEYLVVDQVQPPTPD
jgi:bla regulator protein BlaR1